MAGSVCEWCRDWYDEASYATPGATAVDPLSWTVASGQRNWRGGSWDIHPINCASTHRSRRFPDYSDLNCGLRIISR